jgi:hypothetical protein
LTAEDHSSATTFSDFFECFYISEKKTNFRTKTSSTKEEIHLIERKIKSFVAKESSSVTTSSVAGDSFFGCSRGTHFFGISHN